MFYFCSIEFAQVYLIWVNNDSNNGFNLDDEIKWRKNKKVALKARAQLQSSNDNLSFS